MAPELVFDHLARLTSPLGLHEHALMAEPRPEHGFCVDDVARALVVTARERTPSAAVSGLAAGYLDFLLAAQHDDGLMHNRRNPDGTWGDEPSTGDHWGRALWAFGVTAARSPDPVLANRARTGAETAMLATSQWPRSLAYAALGVGELLGVTPDDPQCRRVLLDVRRHLTPPRHDGSWPWPHPELTYANAVLPEAMVVVGSRLADPTLVADGLLLLEWLVGVQTVDGHLSVVPAGGRRRGERPPAFDQQPIEVAALAEAGRTAHRLTGDDRWAELLSRCVAWFEGDNDAGLAVRDPLTGAGFDGLGPRSVNLNQGAESTLAWLSTLQVHREAGLPTHARPHAVEAG